ncbi:T9SS type A sorting domain-containing protein [Aestuariibaculum sp. YM273]|uniref:T9SS type A sorting domain-containing protein n=1 Tax=Aestuariibaculum sp. YM273 TaxID=3070659 RepID=UPI0027DC5FB5|nr:T9SS type A sorting domain-containing protein [Aestuariibaculum sp. YM273]WMI65044.1 T9SS type A sorting domain-containing protein [Aestuariibaculum sp. YM273]
MKKITVLAFILLNISLMYPQDCRSNTEIENAYVAINNGYTEIVTQYIIPNEYVTVSNILENEYTFTSAITNVNDYITIRDSSGDNILAQGTSPLTYQFQPGQVDDNTIQIHIHLNSGCSSIDNGNHTISLINLDNLPTCYEPLTNSARISYLSNTRLDFYWQAPASGDNPVDYEWEIVPSGNTQGEGVVASGNTGGSTNASTGENALSPNTAYIVFIRSKCDANTYSIWYETPVVTTLSVGPPSNDFCSGAISILQETGISSVNLSENTIQGSVAGGAGTDIIAESCNGQANARDDIWYSFLAQTTDINITVNSSFDAILTLFSGDCNNLTQISCSDINGGVTTLEQISYTGLTVGDTYYFRVYSQPFTVPNPNFTMNLWSPTATTDFDDDGYSDEVDCDDSNPSIYEPQLYYEDKDEDGYGSSVVAMRCELTPSPGFSTNSEDCNDDDPNINPDTVWYRDFDEDGYGDINSTLTQCDQPLGYVLDNTDCNDSKLEISPETVWYEDSDQDGYGDINSTLTQCTQPVGYVLDNTDCDDNNGAINADTVWYRDFDEDGYGDINTTLTQCTKPVGYILNPTDCDDTDPDINPDTVWYRDSDEDGYGDINSTLTQCDQPLGYVLDNTDCNDSKLEINPETVWYEDSDQDGYGDINSTLTQCTQPQGYVLNSEDCDDAVAEINPNANEIPGNSIDENCDGSDSFVWYEDADDDGFGNLNVSLEEPSQPAGYVLDNSDCDDTNPAIHEPIIYYVDNDGDGYGTDVMVEFCLTSAPEGYSTISGDSNDADDTINPSATEVCDGVDNDSDGEIDEGFSDTDGDGIADCVDTETCDGVDNDGDGDVDEGFPDTDGDGIADCVDTETCDGIDNDGDGDIDEGFQDTDQDGVADCVDDCPNDPNKVDSGSCGCGVADTDSDGDGTPDCNDLCPSDPNKTDPGNCGCGVADADSDGDGTPDCNDLCPSDPNKTDPGSCGCGVADTDSDGDGTPDCNDLCPSDPIKTDPGNCGCGVVDTDSDGDGTPDCTDLCPSDPNKNDPGSCGCGVSDIDSDQDGTPDCDDNCPDDPNKTDPGSCGCGVSDIDTDQDGTPDCDDNCPNDPNKTDQGSCGCGVSDIDTDQDGVADCDDVCPGFDDAVDSDNDGIPDGCESLSVEKSLLNELFVKPNPFNSMISVMIPKIFVNTDFEITIFDLNGRLILNRNVKNVNQQIQIEHLEAFQQGMYLIKIKSLENNQSIVRQIVKF